MPRLNDRWIVPPKLVGKEQTASEIAWQLFQCGYECEAGPLHLNTSFQALVKLALDEGCSNWGQRDDGSIGPCYDCDHCKLFEDM